MVINDEEFKNIDKMIRHAVDKAYNRCIEYTVYFDPFLETYLENE